MRNTLVAGVGAALALLAFTPQAAHSAMLPAERTGVVSGADNLVEVRRGGRHFGRGFARHRGIGRFRGFRHRGFRHHRGWRHRGLRHRGWRRGYGLYFGRSYGYRSCGWLRRRAIITGSSYWWRRYHACRY